MILKHSSLETLEAALAEVNRVFSGNIRIKRYTVKPSGTIQFTLSVLHSSLPGSRLSPFGRHVSAACWHVHGLLFDTILSLSPDAVIETGMKSKDGKKHLISRFGGNWQDMNIGSIYHPFMYSDACDCRENPFVYSKLPTLN